MYAPNSSSITLMENNRSSSNKKSASLKIVFKMNMVDQYFCSPQKNKI